MAQEIRAMPEEMDPKLWRGFKSPTPSWKGNVAALFIAPISACAMVSQSRVRAFADRGLEGDRFFRDSWNDVKRPDKAVSLIEAETLEFAAQELGVESIADQTRRNIVTQGVPLIDLLHREFIIGGVRMRGIRLFEPCGHLVKVTRMPAIFAALHHRSGLKAAILSDGVISLGDAVALEPVATMATA